MTSVAEFKEAILRCLRSLTQDQCMTVPDIYSCVKGFVSLDREDWEPESPGSQRPKWQRNVRNALQDLNGKDIKRARRGCYALL